MNAMPTPVNRPHFHYSNLLFSELHMGNMHNSLQQSLTMCPEPSSGCRRVNESVHGKCSAALGPSGRLACNRCTCACYD